MGESPGPFRSGMALTRRRRPATPLLQEPLIADERDQLMDDAVRNLRALFLAGEHFRQVVGEVVGLGTTESQALTYLAVHGETGQSAMARSLGLTSSASTALVDRLERQGVAVRVRHPRDRRRAIVRLTGRGAALVKESRRWLTASLDHVDPDQLAVVSRSLALIADDLVSRTADDHLIEDLQGVAVLPA